MHPGRRPEGVATQDGVVGREGHADLPRDHRTVRRQPGEWRVMHSRQNEIDEEQIHLDVADALPDAEGGSVDSVRARLDRRQRVGQTETPVPGARASRPSPPRPKVPRYRAARNALAP